MSGHRARRGWTRPPLRAGRLEGRPQLARGRDSPVAAGVVRRRSLEGQRSALPVTAMAPAGHRSAGRRRRSQPGPVPRGASVSQRPRGPYPLRASNHNPALLCFPEADQCLETRPVSAKALDAAVRPHGYHDERRLLARTSPDSLGLLPVDPLPWSQCWGSPSPPLLPGLSQLASPAATILVVVLAVRGVGNHHGSV